MPSVSNEVSSRHSDVLTYSDTCPFQRCWTFLTSAVKVTERCAPLKPRHNFPQDSLNAECHEVISDFRTCISVYFGPISSSFDVNTTIIVDDRTNTKKGIHTQPCSDLHKKKTKGTLQMFINVQYNIDIENMDRMYLKYIIYIILYMYMYDVWFNVYAQVLNNSV